MSHGVNPLSFRKIEVENSVGTVLAHDVTEIRRDEFKGRAFRKGHIIRPEDVCHLQRLGKEHLYVLQIAEDEIHEDDAALALASVLMGEGVATLGEPREGKVTMVAERDGLFRVHRDALLRFNMLGYVMCATLHDNTLVKRGCVVAGTRAIPLVLKKSVISEARIIGDTVRNSPGGLRSGILEVKELAKPKAGIVITGNEVFSGRVSDSFEPIIIRKIKEFGGDIVGVFRCPDDESIIESRIRGLVRAGADLIITTGGMSVDPDDVTRFAIRRAGGDDVTYGSAVLPGAMFLVAYLRGDADGAMDEERAGRERDRIPVLGVPACAMYHKTTVLDLILPRILAGEHIGRRELADMGHGGLCRECSDCRFPACPFGK